MILATLMFRGKSWDCFSSTLPTKIFAFPIVWFSSLKFRSFHVKSLTLSCFWSSSAKLGRRGAVRMARFLAMLAQKPTIFCVSSLSVLTNSHGFWSWKYLFPRELM